MLPEAFLVNDVNYICTRDNGDLGKASLSATCAISQNGLATDRFNHVEQKRIARDSLVIAITCVTVVSNIDYTERNFLSSQRSGLFVKFTFNFFHFRPVLSSGFTGHAKGNIKNNEHIWGENDSDLVSFSGCRS